MTMKDFISTTILKEWCSVGTENLQVKCLAWDLPAGLKSRRPPRQETFSF